MKRFERPSFARRSGLREGGCTPCPAGKRTPLKRAGSTQARFSGTTLRIQVVGTHGFARIPRSRARAVVADIYTMSKIGRRSHSPTSFRTDCRAGNLWNIVGTSKEKSREGSDQLCVLRQAQDEVFSLCRQAWPHPELFEGRRLAMQSKVRRAATSARAAIDKGGPLWYIARRPRTGA